MTVYVIYSIYEYGDGSKSVRKDDKVYLSLEEAKAKADESHDFIFIKKAKKMVVAEELNVVHEGIEYQRKEV